VLINAVFEELKACVETISISVIFFSALQPAKVREKAVQLSADGFIYRSADQAEMMAKIIEILS
jgi:DNA-binding NarL/FixJ family response regulator